jgi:hypothetical protein
LSEPPFVPREGRELPSGPFEGVPTHLGPRLSEWLADQLEYETALNDLILVARISVPGRSHEQIGATRGLGT